MLTLEVLISCMHQKDHSIIERTNIQSDVIVINQCDIDKREEFTFLNKKGETCHAIFISTTERGLSKSRNMAIKNATADICLICDDDEILDNEYYRKISQSFQKKNNSDIIAFQIQNSGKIFPKKEKHIGYIGALKLVSWQLSFRRKSIISKGIKFDETIGSGITKSGGEENIFLYDCLKKGLNIIYVPISIGKMFESPSQWLNGFTPEMFFDHGVKIKKLMGKGFASIYALYFIITKFSLYHKELKVSTVITNIYNGIFRN